MAHKYLAIKYTHVWVDTNICKYEIMKMINISQLCVSGSFVCGN